MVCNIVCVYLTTFCQKSDSNKLKFAVQLTEIDTGSSNNFWLNLQQLLKSADLISAKIHFCQIKRTNNSLSACTCNETFSTSLISNNTVSEFVSWICLFYDQGYRYCDKIFSFTENAFICSFLHDVLWYCKFIFFYILNTYL